MIRKKRILSVVLSFAMIFTVVSPVSASETSECDCKSSVVYTNEETGNKVVEVQKDGKSYYAAVSSPIEYDLNETQQQLMKENPNPQQNKLHSDKNEQITLEKVYFQFEDSLESATNTANAPVIENSDKVQIQGSFWKGSFIEKIWELWYGSGYKVHISSGDAGYMQGIGVAVVTTLFGLLAAEAVISAGMAAAVVGIVTAGILTLYQAIRNVDGSVDFEMFEPNLVNNIICLIASKYMGQARNNGSFRNYYWPAAWATYCLP
ncbi:hypothetical protein [Paenibacillus cellulositrophicus]|uniref:hypothetical protein n=1 Tax=Paenibacillus cellulositrophicus TaxID=562959 RepID=UPI003D9795D2